MLRLKNDSERLRGEYFKISPYLRQVIADIDVWLHEAGYDTVITCLLRTDAEQFALFQGKASTDRKSVHQFGRGCDLRITFPDAVGEDLLEYINKKHVYDSSRPKFRTAGIHGGTAQHVHVKTLK